MKTSPKICTQPHAWEITDARAIDGDTIVARILLGFSTSLVRRVRLKGFYAPEHHGATPGAAQEAQQRLQAAMNGQELHLLAHGSQDDLHGRLVAVLVINGVAANPYDILGPWQLTHQAHANDLRIAKRQATGKRGAL